MILQNPTSGAKALRQLPSPLLFRPIRLRRIHLLHIRPRPAPRLLHPITILRQSSITKPTSFHVQNQTRPASTTTTSTQSTSPSSTTDTTITRLTDLYATARDEFEIAAEETAAKTVYGAADREAAAEAFTALKTAYEEAVARHGEEVERRVGTRVRELERALQNLDELAGAEG